MSAVDADGGASFPFCLQHEVCEFLGLEESSPSSATPEELMVVCVWCAVCVWGEAGEWECRKEEFTRPISGYQETLHPESESMFPDI